MMRIADRAPFTIICDTREPQPCGFRFPETVSVALPDGSKRTHPVRVIRETMRTGDYTTPALRACGAIERKAPGDMAACVTHERDRFDREIVRLGRLRYRAILVEGCEHDVLEASPMLHRNALAGAGLSFLARHGVPIIYARSAEDAAWRCLALLRRWQEEEVRRVSRERFAMWRKVG
jgi:ERCC4-type nuclease